MKGEIRQRDYDHGYGVGYEDGIKESALEIESLRGAMRVLEDAYDRIKTERDEAIAELRDFMRVQTIP